MTLRAVLFVLAMTAGALAQAGAPADVSLAARTLIVRNEPMLDVVDTGDRLLVLGPETIAWYARADALAGGAPGASVPLTHARPWPRDLRGRLRTTANGFEALLPGVV